MKKTTEKIAMFWQKRVDKLGEINFLDLRPATHKVRKAPYSTSESFDPFWRPDMPLASRLAPGQSL